MRKPETRLEERCDEILMGRNIPFVDTSIIGKGVADRIIAFNGRYVEIEYKTRSRQLQNQKLRQSHLESQNNIYVIIQSARDLENFLDYLRSKDV